MKIRVKLQAVVQLNREQAKEFKVIDGKIYNQGDEIFLIGFRRIGDNPVFPIWSIDNEDECPKKAIGYDDYEVEELELVEE